MATFKEGTKMYYKQNQDRVIIKQDTQFIVIHHDKLLRLVRYQDSLSDYHVIDIYLYGVQDTLRLEYTEKSVRDRMYDSLVEHHNQYLGKR